MKKLVAAAFSLLFAGSAMASPYLYLYPISRGSHLYLSAGAFITPDFSQAQYGTNMALLYHPLSSGSIIPERLQDWLPPESWSVNIGGGSGGRGTDFGGVGISVNLLDSVRGWASRLLALSDNTRLQAMAHLISPSDGPLSLNVGRQEVTDIIRDGRIGPLNTLRFTPRWYFGASYGF